MENKNLIFNVEDIFEEIPGDPDNVIMKIPPEVLEHTGWKEGDILNVSVDEEGRLTLTKHG